MESIEWLPLNCFPFHLRLQISVGNCYTLQLRTFHQMFCFQLSTCIPLCKCFLSSSSTLPILCFFPSLPFWRVSLYWCFYQISDWTFLSTFPLDVTSRETIFSFQTLQYNPCAHLGLSGYYNQRLRSLPDWKGDLVI